MSKINCTVDEGWYLFSRNEILQVWRNSIIIGFRCIKTSSMEFPRFRSYAFTVITRRGVDAAKISFRGTRCRWRRGVDVGKRCSLPRKLYFFSWKCHIVVHFHETQFKSIVRGLYTGVNIEVRWNFSHPSFLWLRAWSSRTIKFSSHAYMAAFNNVLKNIYFV